MPEAVGAFDFLEAVGQIAADRSQHPDHPGEIAIQEPRERRAGKHARGGVDRCSGMSLAVS